MGSIPGVVVGAIVLIGLPELFREFSEYRFLFYGAVLILMMRFRPEGIIPSRIGRQEMHHEASADDPLAATAAAEPLDEPPGVRPGSSGLAVLPGV